MDISAAYISKLSDYRKLVSRKIKVLQQRAHRINEAKSLSLNDILDEWCREFYLEGRRRSDLVRFGLLQH